MNKLLLVIGLAIAAAAYYMSTADSYPNEITFQGVELGSKKDINNTVDEEYDIFSYRDSSNYHVLVIGIRNESSRTLESFLELYLLNFKRQGFSFEEEEGRYYAAKGGEEIYMARIGHIEGVAIYIRKNGISDDLASVGNRGIFSELENIAL